MLNLSEFINTYTGKQGVGNTPQNIGQCVGLIEVWDDNLGESHIWGDARNLVANAPMDYEVFYTGVPHPGDILCFDGTYGNGAGHTGVVTDASPQGAMLFEQNDPLGSTPHLKFYPYAHMVGYIRPKVLEGGPMPIASLSKEEITVIYQLAFLESPSGTAPDDLVNAYTGKALDGLLQQLQVDPTRLQMVKQGVNPGVPPTVLSSGVYKVD